MTISKGTNVVIPFTNAGIGDLVYKSSGGALKVIGRGTANAATLTIDSTSYSLYGAIYGFVNGLAMIVAPGETSAYWAASGVSCSIGPAYGAGTVLMRNGQKTNYYAQMNTSQNQNYIKGGSSDAVVLGSAYQATSLEASTWPGTGTNANAIRAKFGSWFEYIRQTLRVNGAPGTPFGAAYTDGSIPVKVHEFGRWMCRKVYESTETKTNFPAIKYCYEYGEGNGTWWLPSMFELGELMIDEHLDKVNENSLSGWTTVGKGSYRWSCVRGSSTGAWTYDYGGMSVYYGMSNYQCTVRPVTLLRLA